MKKIAIFASGNGSNFEVLAKACQDGRIPAECVLCVCDRKGAYVLERAARLGVPAMEMSPKDFPSKRDYEKTIADRLDAEGVDLVCLAGYMRIVGVELLGRYEGRIVNIHPALLPSFKGAHGIRDAFEYGVKVFGVTVHYIDDTVDGGKIIAQQAFPYEGDDIEKLEEMVHAVEHELYPATVRKLLV